MLAQMARRILEYQKDVRLFWSKGQNGPWNGGALTNDWGESLGEPAFARYGWIVLSLARSLGPVRGFSGRS